MKRFIFRTKNLSLVALVLTTAACGLVPTKKALLVKASAGGLVCTDDQKAHVSILPNALAKDTVITIEPIAKPAAASMYVALGQAYELGPDGTQFSAPATITLTYGPLPAGVEPADVVMLAVSNGTIVEEVKDAFVDVASGTVIGTTTHFTTFLPILRASVQVGGPTSNGGMPLAVATASNPARVDLWLGPQGLVRTNPFVNSATDEAALTIRVDTMGAIVNNTIRVTGVVEDPAEGEEYWHMLLNGRFTVPLESTTTDGSGVLIYTIDGHALEYEVRQAPPGYPSGRVHLTFELPSGPIDLWISLALSPTAAS